MIESASSHRIRPKRKAISALLPYAVSREQAGRHETLDLFLRAARVESVGWGFTWRYIGPLVTTLLAEGSPIPLKRAMILASPHVPWQKFRNGEHLVRLWAVAASAVPCGDDVCQSVVDTLLQIASLDPLSSHIPVDMWSWLNKRPSLHPVCWGRHWGTNKDVLQTIRALGDIEILKSYLLLVWSEWDTPRFEGFDEMYTSIQEDFSGTGMGDHRQDLLRRLCHVLEQLDLGLEHFRQHKPSLGGDSIQVMKGRYGKLEKLLLEVDERARITLTRELH